MEQIYKHTTIRYKYVPARDPQSALPSAAISNAFFKFIQKPQNNTAVIEAFEAVLNPSLAPYVKIYMAKSDSSVDTNYVVSWAEEEDDKGKRTMIRRDSSEIMSRPFTTVQIIASPMEVLTNEFHATLITMTPKGAAPKAPA